MTVDYRIYDIDVSCNSKWLAEKCQLATSKQLNDIGLTCKQWILSADGFHRWRVWIHDPDSNGLDYLKNNYLQVTVVDENIPIPIWCKFPSRLNAKLSKD